LCRYPPFIRLYPWPIVLVFKPLPNIMENINRLSDKLSRRRFVGLSALAGAYAAIPGLSPVFFEQGKPNSTIGGVQVGAITYSWRSMPGTAEDILKYCTQCGISTIELMGDVAESYAGIPKSPAKPAQGKTLSDSEKKALETEAKAFAEKQMNWRLAAPMDKFKELRKMYNNAGVDIHIVKFSPENWTRSPRGPTNTVLITLTARR
jgi:hypothetical protein